MVESLNSKIKLYGYDLLGVRGEEGIRYAWKYEGKDHLLESAAFTQKTKGIEEQICGYTTSVSMGCILKALGKACRFCRTGKKLPFSNMLTAVDITKQNVLMVLADMNCSDNSTIRSNKREFAYMGQGEPGYSYVQVRTAIKLTDIIMKDLNQIVHRHILATCGIPEMIEAYKNDVSTKYFNSRVTMHFSLHATLRRDDIMPINSIYPYKSVLSALSNIYDITGEKPCIGIMLLNKFSPSNSSFLYSNDLKMIQDILQELDPKLFRLSLCEFNDSEELGTSNNFSIGECNEMRKIAQQKGFEVKLFSSFGKKETAACGMLGGKEPGNNVKKKWLELDKYADELILKAINEMKKDEISKFTN